MKHCVVCFGFDISQLIVYSGCSLVTSKPSRHVKDEMICCSCSAWVSKKFSPCKAMQVRHNINARKSRIAPSHSFPEQSRKEAWSFPHSSGLSPHSTEGRVEQAAFPVWTRSQSIRTWKHNWVNELPGVDRGWGFTVGLSWSKIMLLLKGVFLTSFSLALD